MTHNEFTEGLARLSEFRIGVQEATVLFSITPGCTNEDLNLMLGLTKQAIWSAVTSLRGKELIHTSYADKRKAAHTVSAKGKRLIARVIPGGA